MKLTVTPEERAELMKHLAIRKAPADEKRRIRVVLGCAEGQSGKVIGQLKRRHRSAELLQFLKTIDATVPAG
jgi:hypothetical protein